MYIYSISLSPSRAGLGFISLSVCAQFFFPAFDSLFICLPTTPSPSPPLLFSWIKTLQAQSHTIDILKWITHIDTMKENRIRMRWWEHVQTHVGTSNVYLAIAIIWNIYRNDYQRIIFSMRWMWVALRIAHLITRCTHRSHCTIGQDLFSPDSNRIERKTIETTKTSIYICRYSFYYYLSTAIVQIFSALQ